MVAVRSCRGASLVDSPDYRNEPKKHRGLFRSSFGLVPNTIHCRPRKTTGIGLCEAPDLDRRTAGPFCRLVSTAVVSKATCENGCGKLPISPFVFGLYSSAKSPASLRSPMIYKGSARGPYVRFVRAPPSNGIGLIRSFCARWIAAFTTIFALFKNLGWEEKYCLSWQSSSSQSAHAPAYQ